MTDHSEARVEAAAKALHAFGCPDGCPGSSTDYLLVQGLLTAADEVDRSAGVVRVDTKDEALIDRLARVLCEVDQSDIPVERRETMEQTGSGDDFREMVRAVFAELAAGAQPPPEGPP